MPRTVPLFGGNKPKLPPPPKLAPTAPPAPIGLPLYGFRTATHPLAVTIQMAPAVALFRSYEAASLHLPAGAAVVRLNSTAAVAAHVERSGARFVSLDPLPCSDGFYHRSSDSEFRAADFLARL